MAERQSFTLAGTVNIPQESRNSCGGLLQCPTAFEARGTAPEDAGVLGYEP
jgi:hypothetical protein